MFTSGIQILFNVFQTVNKVKQNSIAMIVTGIISSTITIILAKYTNYGIYAVAGVSAFCCLVKNMVFVIPVTTKYLGLERKPFYKQVGLTFCSSIFLIIIGVMVKSQIEINSWITLIIVALIIGIIGLAVNVAVVLNNDEKKYLMNKISVKLRVDKGKE